MRAKSIVILSVFIVFSGCNLTYKVRNQSHNLEEVLHLPCGKVYIELIGKGDSKFSLRQRFELDEKIAVFPDSLRIYRNEKPVEADHNLRTGKGAVEIKGKKDWVSNFDVEDGVFEGDTIFVFGHGYIRCRDDTVSLDTLIYAFDNTFRIFGVNEFNGK